MWIWEWGRGAHVFGGLAENVAHTATVAQPMVHDSDDAHQQGITGPLRVVQLLILCKRSVSSFTPRPGHLPPTPTPPRLPRHIALTFQDLRH